MSRIIILAVVALLCAVAATVTAQNKRFTPQVSNLEELHNWVGVDYNWTGSPWHSKGAAILAKAFIPQNNVVCGVAAYNGVTYVTVPRWRPGVPSTLNRVEKDPVTQTSRLVPFPDWDTNINKFRYVQSMYISSAKGLMYVIDAGRENFFSGDPSDVINGNAALYVYDLNDKNNKIVYERKFPCEIFPCNSSFLNDIVLDETNNIAYMSDTNTAPGQGAMVVLNLNTGFMRRFVAPEMQSNHSYVVTINGIAYPGFNNPIDGITVDDRGEKVYFCPLDSQYLYQVNAAVLSDPSSTPAQIQATVRTVVQKKSASDGLRIMPSLNGMLEYVFYGSNCDNALRVVSFEPRRSNPPIIVDDVLVEKDDYSMQWIDSFARLDVNETHSWLYFTTNRLQLYFLHTMDWSGNSGANMRVWRIMWQFAPNA